MWWAVLNFSHAHKSPGNITTNLPIWSVWVVLVNFLSVDLCRNANYTNPKESDSQMLQNCIHWLEMNWNQKVQFKLSSIMRESTYCLINFSISIQIDLFHTPPEWYANTNANVNANTFECIISIWHTFKWASISKKTTIVSMPHRRFFVACGVRKERF